MLGLLVPLVIYMYYVVIESWCLRYAFAFLTGELDLGSDPAKYMEVSKAFFARTSGVSQDGMMLNGSLDPAVAVWIAVMALNFWILARGLSGGIELVCKWALPAMAVCALIVLVRVLTLGTPDPAIPSRTSSTVSVHVNRTSASSATQDLARRRGSDLLAAFRSASA